jgi:hypothetical protein
LECSDEEREIIKSSWSAYDGDGIGFVLHSAGRLALESEYKIHRVTPGIYHGGAWVLNAYVSEGETKKLPEPWTVSVDGFYVIWIQESTKF